MNSNFFYVRDFCRHYGISKAAFYREVAKGRLHPFKYGHRTLIPAWEAHRWNLARYRSHEIGSAESKHIKSHKKSVFSRFLKFIFLDRK